MESDSGGHCTAQLPSFGELDSSEGVIMPGFRGQGSLCVTTAPVNDVGTMCLSRTPAADILGRGANASSISTSTPMTPLAPPEENSAAGGGGLFSAAHMILGMTLAGVPGQRKAKPDYDKMHNDDRLPEVEKLAWEMLGTPEVTTIKLVLDNKEDPSFPNDIVIDESFYTNVRKLLGPDGTGGTVNIVLDNSLDEGTGAASDSKTKIIRIRSRTAKWRDAIAQSDVLHELTHQGLYDDATLSSACGGAKGDQNKKLYWALSELFAYVAQATFDLKKKVKRDYKHGPKVFSLARSIAEKVAAKGGSFDPNDVRQFVQQIEKEDTSHPDESNGFWEWNGKTYITLTPASGQMGDRITISGKGLAGTRLVKFGGYKAIFSVENDTVTFSVPRGAKSDLVYVWTPKGVQRSEQKFEIRL